MLFSRSVGVIMPRDLLILCISFAFIFMGAGAQQQFLSPFFAEVTNWSPVVRGFIPATVYFTMAVWRLPAVWVVSKIGERTAMLLGGSAYVIFPAVIYFSSSQPATYWSMILGAFLWGVGATLMWVTSSTRVLDVVNRTQYGKASGAFIGAVFGGILIGVFLLTWVGAVFSLRDVFLTSSVITAIGWGILFLLPDHHVKRARPSIKAVLEVTRRTDWRVVGAMLALSSMGYGLMLVPLGECIVDGLGVSSLALAAGYPAARLVVGLVGGWMSDVVGRRNMIVGAFLIAGVGLGLTTLSTTSPITLGIGIFAIGLLGGVAPTMGLASAGDMSSSENRLMVHASLFMHNDLGIAVAMILGQLLQVQLGGFAPTFGVFSILILACGIWAFVVFRRQTA
jgi:MFS family permease